MGVWECGTGVREHGTGVREHGSVGVWDTGQEYGSMGARDRSMGVWEYGSMGVREYGSTGQEYGRSGQHATAGTSVNTPTPLSQTKINPSPRSNRI